ncbi:MAG: ATP-NAD kinase family protein [Candidatus Odinarchaeum yellowstonii]|uniref:ATP-NAD kinase family protein n=1 Tax=Odinarchaeota yellowstonii (strain LCB_4) TaxID=1841599 RepID=A0AAF0IDF7_ODILC|nr:MAG: ATP-NAD kinase family protein [Candidatus Odinarchaeum yellowstonii]
MFKLGLIVNPIAGLGGAAGFKGTDKPFIVVEALKMGVQPQAPLRAKEVFKKLTGLRDKLYIYTASGSMGGFILEELGFKGEIIYHVKKEGYTTAQDTRNCAQLMLDKNLDLLVFCGGDGTAVDIVDVIDMKIPILGIPAGVKMHSGVFAATPLAAAAIIREAVFLELPFTEMEVMDIDEDAFRRGVLSTKLRGYAKVPYQPFYIQGSKTASPNLIDDQMDKEEIAKYIADIMENDVYYILGPGTTVAAVADFLGIEKTLLGVDVVINKRLFKKDVNEKDLLSLDSSKPAKIIVTVIGSQGFIFGRGNQQISSKVIRRVGVENILVVATPYKLSTLKGLRVDTGDPELDAEFKGYLKVITGYGEKELVKVLTLEEDV